MSQLLLRKLGASRFSVLDLLRRAGIDRAVGFTILGRSWTAFSGLITLILMTRCLSLPQQGYWVTFGSILSTTVFFEMGTSLILVQFASHEQVGLKWTATGTLSGNADAKSRLASLFQMSLHWYTIVGAVFVAVLLPVGFVFFAQHTTPGIRWQGPWLWAIFVAGASLTLTSVMAILEGCGLITEIVRLQFWQGVAGSLLLWLGLTLHWGLFAVVLTNTVSLVGSLLWLRLTRWPLLRDLMRTPNAATQTSWRKEIWPLQWQVALSCVSGYFIMQLFNPALFMTHGAASAGQMGLSLIVVGTVASIPTSWVATKSARFGMLVAQRDFSELDRLFFPCLWQSWGLVTVLVALVWGVGFTFHALNLPLCRRFLSPLPLGLLAVAVVANHGINATAFYLRAHKKEPFLFMSLGYAFLIGLSVLLLSKPFGAVGLMAAYACISTLALIASLWIFMQKRRLWHGSTSKI